MGKNSTNQAGTRDVALAAGVSTATVSRVFNQYSYVSEQVREKVIRAARELGYAPSIISSKNLFAVVMPGHQYDFHPYFSQVISVVAQELFAHGCNIQIFNRNVFLNILRNTYRGVLVFSAKDADYFRKAEIPCVVVNDVAAGFWNVATDHAESLQIAVEYLLRKNHRRIAYLWADYTSWGSLERIRGFRETMSKAGIPEDEQLCSVFASPGEIPVKIRELLKREITALIVEGEDYGLIADHALKQTGVKIPEDLSLITFESRSHSNFLYPEHTTIAQDFRELGKAAADTLLKLMNCPDPLSLEPETRLFHNHLIERASCREL